jgi:hypothetical protein
MGHAITSLSMTIEGGRSIQFPPTLLSLTDGHQFMYMHMCTVRGKNMLNHQHVRVMVDRYVIIVHERLNKLNCCRRTRNLKSCCLRLDLAL